MEVSLLLLPLTLGREDQAEIGGGVEVGYLKSSPSASVPVPIGPGTALKRKGLRAYWSGNPPSGSLAVVLWEVDAICRDARGFLSR